MFERSESICIRGVVLVAALCVCNFSLAFDVQGDARRIVAVLDFKSSTLREENKPDRACVERVWPEKAQRIEAVFVANFSPEELNRLANFFESVAGRKWDERSAIQSRNDEVGHANEPVPPYAPGEEKTVARFLNSTEGKKFMKNNEFGKALNAIAFRVGFEMSRACGGKDINR